MNVNELRTYRILAAVESSPPPSQREIAQKLGISLGLANSFIKRLAKKGYFKITTIPKNRVNYILTPKGAAEKARLTYEYIRHSFRYYRDIRSHIKDLFAELEHRREMGVVFYGVSELAEIAFVTLQETRLHLVAIVDDKLAGEGFFKHTVQSPEILKKMDFDVLLVTSVEPALWNQRNEVLAGLAARWVDALIT